MAEEEPINYETDYGLTVPGEPMSAFAVYAVTHAAGKAAEMAAEMHDRLGPLPGGTLERVVENVCGRNGSVLVADAMIDAVEAGDYAQARGEALAAAACLLRLAVLLESVGALPAGGRRRAE